MRSAGQSVKNIFHSTVGPERVYTPSNKMSMCAPAYIDHLRICCSYSFKQFDECSRCLDAIYQNRKLFREALLERLCKTNASLRFRALF